MESGDTGGTMKSLGRLCGGMDVTEERLELTLLDLLEDAEGQIGRAHV